MSVSPLLFSEASGGMLGGGRGKGVFALVVLRYTHSLAITLQERQRLSFLFMYGHSKILGM